jgi:CDP-2,3-bis-(O-geranylgeranyl)-sn-glycerol synthase
MRGTIDALHVALFLIATFVAAGLVHSAWLRSPASRRLCIPIDGGRRIRGRRIFGDNKTIRGFVVMVPAAAVAFAVGALVVGDPGRVGLWDLTVIQYAALGAWAGFGFMAAELPNSFVKRQLDIAPGTAPASRVGAVLGFLVDRLDSLLGLLIAVSVVVPTPPAVWAWMLVIGPAVHWSFSVLLYRTGVKARPA